VAEVTQEKARELTRPALLLQPRLTVGPTDDPYEREAEHAAEVAVRPGASFGSLRSSALANNLSPVAQRAPAPHRPILDDEKKRHEEKKHELRHDQPMRVQKAPGTASPPEIGPNVEHRITALMSGGTPLPESTRASLESPFGRSFDHVRIHTDAAAASVAVSVGARAFTVGSHVFFGSGEYRPASTGGRKLIAHELAHTIQQEPDAGQGRRVRRLPGVLSAIAGRVRAWAMQLPGYELLGVILGRDPITEEPVQRSVANIAHATLRLVPGGDAVFEHLAASGALQREQAWLDTQIAQLNLSWDGIMRLIGQAVDAMSVFHPFESWQAVRRIFQPTLDRIITFVRNVGAHVFDLVKRWALDRLREFAQGVRGYRLLTFVLGRDPFTDAEVPRTADLFIHAVLELIPGGEEVYQNLKRSHTIERTMTWLHLEIARLDLTWDSIKALFRQAWDAFSITDILHPIALFERMRGIFGPPLGRLLTFTIAVGRKALEFIFEGVMTLAGPLGAQVVRIFHRAAAVFDQIVADPVRFVHNLIDAIGLGFRQFMHNIAEHLRTGVIRWLTGALEGAGVVLPQVWNLEGILSLVLQILGITWQRIRQKIVRVIGEERMQQLERVFDFIQTLITRGPMALWGRIVESLGNLWETVIGGIRQWAITRIVTAAVTRLLTMFNPAGAVIQAVIAIYDTIKFFIQKIQQIADTVEAIVDSIARIAAGILGPAANAVERAMARTIPVVLDFLAELIGLGDISGQIRRIIEAIQARVDAALDRAVNWVVERGRALLGRGTAPAGQPAAAGDERWNAAAAGVNAELDHLLAAGVDPEDIQHQIPAWKQRFGFTNLEVTEAEGQIQVSGEMSPKRVIRALPVGIDYDHQLQGNRARRMHAVPIRQTPYSAPYDELVGWDRLNHNFWIRGHLLHGRSGGPGAFWNMTPIPKSTNLAMYSGHEEHLHDSVLDPSKNPLIWFRAEVDYYTAGDSRVDRRIARPSDFPKLITVQYGKAKKKSSGWVEGPATITKPYSVDPPTTGTDDMVPSKVSAP